MSSGSGTIGATSLVPELVRRALSDEPSQGLHGLVEAIARAAGASSAVLWEAVGSDSWESPSVLAAWSALADETSRHDFTADDLTVTALQDMTVTLPDHHAGDSDASATMAAFALAYLDGSRGALTLYGDSALTEDVFDLVVESLDMLPMLGRAVRDRQSLELSRRCDRLLAESELRDDGRLLARDVLDDYLSRICAVVGEALACDDVSMYLSDTGDPNGPFALAARSGTVTQGPGPGPDDLTVRSIRDGVARVALPVDSLEVDGTGGQSTARSSLIAVPITSGDQVWGALSCGAPVQRPFYFTTSDISLLELLASQLAQHWVKWLQRRLISTEIESWRRLAADVTEFNQLLARELKRKQPRDVEVESAAVQIVGDVLPMCRATVQPEPGPDPESQQRAGAPPPPHWEFTTRISVGDETFGWLKASGDQASAPPNAAQVCEIVGDQLGLFHHLRRTLTTLRTTQRTAESSARAQADALEDLQHQLAGPLLAATNRTERLLRVARLDSRSDLHLRAVRGLCRRASRVAMSAGVFAALSQGKQLQAKTEVLGADDILRMLISAADDAQILRDPREKKRFEVDRDSIRALGGDLVTLDVSFLEQCVGNVVDNAGKYSFEETQIDIGGEVRDDHFAVVVTSRGIALSADDVDACKQRNWRGRNARGVTGEGSGLGLWIVDHLMTAMGGRMEISPVDRLTSVHLVLPLLRRRKGT